MKISYNWLNEFLPVQKSPEELAQLLTDTGLEVEGLEVQETVKGGLEGVVVAEVLTCDKHPNADRLKVTTVSNGTDVLQVVCGAPNVAAGQKVILAQVGATLYPSPGQPMKMKVSKIRDVESHGMLCAEDELGIGTNHDGILVLPENAPVGMPIAEFLELENDTQIEIGLTPNRADAMGHVGVARDVLAHMACHENSMHTLNLKPLNGFSVTGSLPISIEVSNVEKCPRYMGVSIANVTVKSSPAWLQKRLRAVGLSPINNIVDVTNYVMRELGTPLHAFDADKIGGKVVVRTAHAGEKMVTLDGVERALDPTDLVIANATTPMCIAGVFGGNDSGIQDATTQVFLEAAFFQPVSVRKTAKRHGLNTDASFRFERGVDVDLVPYALKRATDLILQVAGGEVGMEPLDLYPNPIEKRKVTLRFARCASVLGHAIAPEMIKRILTALDFEIQSENADQLELLVPNYRVDVDREIDVIEEILRIYGFNQVPLPEKLNTSIVLYDKPDIERLTVNLSEALAGMGFGEMMNNSLTSAIYTEKLGKELLAASKNVELLNPLSLDLNVMRQTLIFQALETIAHNQNRQHPDLRLFEFGKVYRKINGEYQEGKRLLLTVCGRKEPENWNATNDKTSLYTLKGALNSLFARLGMSGLIQEDDLNSHDLLSDGYSVAILKNHVASVGSVNKAVLKHFGVKQEVFVAELDWDVVIDSLKLTKTIYKELPKAFAVRRDFSLLLNNDVRFAQIKEVAKKVDKKLLQEVGLFDVYEGKNLPDGKKSYAVSFLFQDAENTLKDEQVDRIMDQIRQQLETQLGAELRS